MKRRFFPGSGYGVGETYSAVVSVLERTLLARIIYDSFLAHSLWDLEQKFGNLSVP